MRTPLPLLALGTLLVIARPAPASADEVRLESGEILHGRAEADDGGGWTVHTADGVRRLRAKDVARVLPGEDPQTVLALREAALEPEDADARAALALWAWSKRLDADARRLAAAAIASGDASTAHALLGHVETGAGHEEGWSPPFGLWELGPRWSREGATTADRRIAEQALDWLAAHQDPEGQIDADGFARHCPADDTCDGAGGGHHGERIPCPYDGAVTAVALLGWSAYGSTANSGRYEEAIARAIPVLVRTVDGGGGFDAIWNVAFATEALADASLAGRDPAVRAAAARGAARLLRAQKADGGWSYVHTVGDVPTSACVLQALGTAAQAGIGIPKAAIERALAFLDARVDAGSGRSEYHEGAEHTGYTPTTANAAAAMAARALLGAVGDAPARSKQLAAVRRRKPRWEIRFEEVRTPDGRTVRAQVGNLYPYAWYHATRAMFHAGGAGAGSWSRALRSALEDGQETEGHRAGSLPPIGTYATSGGRAFATGLCALMALEAERYPRGR